MLHPSYTELMERINGEEIDGEEPVIAYQAAVENEITAVRMILTGRLAGIAPGVIRERLRDLYA